MKYISVNIYSCCRDKIWAEWSVKYSSSILIKIQFCDKLNENGNIRSKWKWQTFKEEFVHNVCGGGYHEDVGHLLGFSELMVIISPRNDLSLLKEFTKYYRHVNPTAGVCAPEELNPKGVKWRNSQQSASDFYLQVLLCSSCGLG